MATALSAKLKKLKSKEGGDMSRVARRRETKSFRHGSGKITAGKGRKK